METKKLDEIINNLESLKRLNEITDSGEETLTELKLIKEELRKHSVMLTFADLQDGILKHKAKREYKQASIIIVRDIFKANAT